ncbi:MAG: hypothetical protein SGILL_007640, partial [Bacillariaceae sp.]
TVNMKKSKSTADCKVKSEMREHLAKTRQRRSDGDLVPFDAEQQNTTSSSTSFKMPKKSCLRRESSQSCCTDLSDELQTSATISPPNSKSSTSMMMTMKKNVSFHKIEIAEHAYELGDNPSCAGGCPIQIGWEPMQKIALDVEEYEEQRSAKRNKDQMRLPSLVRDHLATQSGASRADVQKATKQARIISKSRYRSIKSQKWDNLHYQLEKTSRTIRKVTSVDGIRKLGKSNRRWSNPNLEDKADKEEEPSDELSSEEETLDTNEELDESKQLEEASYPSEEPLSF